jgi:hypothetical protein
MGQLAPTRSYWIRPRGRVRPRKSDWQEPKGGRLTLRPVESTASQWPSKEEQCKTATTTVDISPGYKRAIALLRSLRNASEEEAQRQRESWELLKQDLDENKYH